MIRGGLTRFRRVILSAARSEDETPAGDHPARAMRAGSDPHEHRGSSFATATEPVELLESRRELVREVQWWLSEWERSRDPEARGRLLQSLDVLALLVRGPS